MNYRKHLIFTIFFIFSTVSYSQDLFKGFKVLNIPRENIPIGAEWINGVGVNGSGVSEKDLTKSKSLSTFNIDKDFKQQIDLGILNFLGLSGDYTNNTVITYTGIKIYTITDLSKTNIRSGQTILYEGVKADSITVKISKKLDASLKAQVDEKIKLNAVTDYTKGVTFSGSDLFLAYRVFEIGKLKIKRKEVPFKHSVSAIRTHRAKVMEYEITLNVKDLEKCSIRPSKTPNKYGNTYLVSHLLDCEKTIPIKGEIKNLSDIDFSGKPLTKSFQTYNNKELSQQFSKRKNTKLISDNITISTNVYHDEKYYYLQLTKETKVTISRVTTSLEVLKNTFAPGW